MDAASTPRLRQLKEDGVPSDKSMETSNAMEPTLPVVEDNVVGATSELVVVEDRHSPTSLAQYWKLDPLEPGLCGGTRSCEAESDASQVKGQANPYQNCSHNGGQWRTGHLSGRMAGTE
jgi:hypothetical protein